MLFNETKNTENESHFVGLTLKWRYSFLMSECHDTSKHIKTCSCWVPLYKEPPSAYSMTRATGCIVAPYNFTIFGCETRDNCLNSIWKAFLSWSVSINLTATSTFRQIPLRTTPKVPLPTTCKNDNQNIHLIQVFFSWSFIYVHLRESYFFEVDFFSKNGLAVSALSVSHVFIWWWQHYKQWWLMVETLFYFYDCMQSD